MFDLTTKELRDRLKTTSQAQFTAWAAKNGIALEHIDGNNIKAYLHSIFQEIPFDRDAIGRIIELAVNYLEPDCPHTFQHLITIGTSSFAQQHLTYILKTILQPFAEHHHFSIHTFTYDEIVANINRHNGEFNIHDTARIIIVQLSQIDQTTDLSHIIDTLQTVYTAINAKYHRLLVTAWSTDVWQKLQPYVLANPHAHTIIELVPFVEAEFNELIRYTMKFIGYTHDIDDAMIEYVFTQCNGDLDDAVKIFMEAFKNMCASHTRVIDFNDIVTGCLTIACQHTEEDRST